MVVSWKACERSMGSDFFVQVKNCRLVCCLCCLADCEHNRGMDDADAAGFIVDQPSDITGNMFYIVLPIDKSLNGLITVLISDGHQLITGN